MGRRRRRRRRQRRGRPGGPPRRRRRGGLPGGAFSGDSERSLQRPPRRRTRRPRRRLWRSANGACAAAATPAPPRLRRRPRPRPRRARADGAAAQQTTPEASRLLAAAAQPSTVSPTASSRALAQATQPPPSSTGWVTLQDPSSGRTYYEHAGRGLTTWEKPAELEDDDAELRAALAASAAQPPPVDEDARIASGARSERAGAAARATRWTTTRNCGPSWLYPRGRPPNNLLFRTTTWRGAGGVAPGDAAAGDGTFLPVLAAAGLSRHLPLFGRRSSRSRI